MCQTLLRQIELIFFFKYDWFLCTARWYLVVKFRVGLSHNPFLFIYFSLYFIIQCTKCTCNINWLSVLSVLYIFVSIHSEPSNIGNQTGVLLVSLIRSPLSQRLENGAGSDSDQSDFLVWSHDRSKVNARNDEGQIHIPWHFSPLETVSQEYN